MESPARRTYTMGQRRASMDDPRARILDAAVELYETEGPATATMSAVANRAGVTRATLYRHFSHDADLANAVIDDWQRSVGTVTDLRSLYAVYRSSQGILATLTRDARALPAGRADDLSAPARRVRETLAGGGAGSAWSAATAHAVAFATWQSLAQQGLDDGTIADLMTRFVATAVAVKATPAPEAPSTAPVRAPKRPAASATAGASAPKTPAAAKIPKTPAAAKSPKTPKVPKPPKTGPALLAEKPARDKAVKQKAPRDKAARKAKAQRKQERKAKGRAVGDA